MAIHDRAGVTFTTPPLVFNVPATPAASSACSRLTLSCPQWRRARLPDMAKIGVETAIRFDPVLQRNQASGDIHVGRITEVASRFGDVVRAVECKQANCIPRQRR